MREGRSRRNRSGARRRSSSDNRRGRPDRGRRPEPEETEPPSDPEQVAHAIALRQLTLQPRTRAELAGILRRRGIPDDAAEKVLARLEDVRLIDDEAYAHAWVESRHSGRGLARRALAYELRKRGVDDDIVVDAVEQLDPDTELETARALVARRLPSTRRYDTPARIRRLAGMLARKGYSSAIALRVVREALAEEARADDEAEHVLEALGAGSDVDDLEDLDVDDLR